MLIKTDFSGNIIGSVKDLCGHLGCISFDPEANRIYGSLEYKHDTIGKEVITEYVSDEDAFYLVSFDCSKINKTNISAIDNDVMKSVYLKNVLKDYSSNDKNSGKLHNYGCSGIDGVAFGPVFGSEDTEKQKIMVAYGIYADTAKADNDYQIILQYDPGVFEKYGKTASKKALHHSGPESYEEKYCYYTGNTTYGIQNLTYDRFTDCYFAAVYPGTKTSFTNYSLFCIDIQTAPTYGKMSGRNESAKILASGKAFGTSGNKKGIFFDYGVYGMTSTDGNVWYFAESNYSASKKMYSATLKKFRLNNGGFVEAD